MSIYDFTITRLDGGEQTLAPFRGEVLLIVNVASQCGFTPQYVGLEALYRKFHGRGFEVLGFPCNQFGQQEPGDAAQIQNFCRDQYDVSFPLFAKIDVNGPNAHPLYQHLKHERSGILGTEGIKWNFTKFLLARDGTALKRFGSRDKPESLTADIEAALK